MKKRILLLILLIVTGSFLTGCDVMYKISSIFRFGEQLSFDYGVTAQQWFPNVLERAKQWRADAYFYGISETTVNTDGASDVWKYLFYSPGSEKTAMVIYEAGFISIKEVALSPLNSARKFKLDSPTALNTANQHGGTEFKENNKNISIIMSLSGPKYGGGYKRRPQWFIKYYGDLKALTFVIDAVSGKLLVKK